MHLSPLEQSMPFGYHHSSFHFFKHRNHWNHQPARTDLSHFNLDGSEMPILPVWVLDILDILDQGARLQVHGLTLIQEHVGVEAHRDDATWYPEICTLVQVGVPRGVSTVAGGSLRSVDLGFYHDLCIIISYNNLEYIDISLYHIVSHDGHPIETLHYDLVNSPLSLTISHWLTVDSCPGEACFH